MPRRVPKRAGFPGNGQRAETGTRTGNEFEAGFRSNREFDLLVAANFTIFISATGGAPSLSSLLTLLYPGVVVFFHSFQSLPEHPALR